MTKDYIITQSKLANEIAPDDKVPKSSAVKTYVDDIETALAADIALKADASALTTHTLNTNNPHSVTAAQVGLGNVNNTSDADKPISTLTQAALDGKVDKVEGKKLSTEDYTTAEKTKLAGIETAAEVNIIEVVKVNDTPLGITDKAVNIDLTGKVDKEDGKSLMTEAEHTKLAGIAEGAEVNVNADWTAISGDAQILNKPFTSIGEGLVVTNGALNVTIKQFKFEVVTVLPETGESHIIYLKAHAGSETGNVYDEYIYTEGGWELIGTTQFTLNIVQDTTGIKINNTALQAATDSQTGLITAADHATFAAKQDALTFDDAPVSGSANPVKSGGVYTALGGKADKASGSNAFTIGCDSTGFYVDY